jgi:Asp-tRNA(Asn)/Glu-tRNA(Gln) amidotransferase A subunit family amidase
MVPLAIGTQTVGSVVRPASFCGVVGYKPTFGMFPREGILPQAAPLDTPGVFARTLEDAALLADALAMDGADEDRAPRHFSPHLLDSVLSSPPTRPSFAFVKTQHWALAEPATQEGFAKLVANLGAACREIELPTAFADAPQTIHTLARVGTARHYGRYHDRGADQLSAFMRGAIEEGRRISAIYYLASLDRQKALATMLDEHFDGFDAILTPAAPGEAPSIETTGNPSFNGLWTLCGVPAITLPLLTGSHGLPIGVQLIGRRGDDGRLFRTARWLREEVMSKGS